ncbi:MAG: hypothetical protein KJ630_09765 [Proteobacteria bacterium]|nr:hypothetical protein [Pseudomonadota bacterium]
MEKTYKYRTLVLVLGVTLLVYCFAHWQGICSSYVINDDVRQQIYWMQEWQDPGLFKGHYLTEYAKQYVPWGVQAIYWAASHYINPVQFSKILTAILFTVTAGLLFVLASELWDELTGILTVCMFYYFGFFLGAISGGLSRGFVFPLLILYLIFLSRGKTKSGGVVLMVQSLFNPYLFVLCLLTHGLFLVHNQHFRQAIRSAALPTPNSINQKRSMGTSGFLLSQYFPPVLGMIFLFAKYQIFQDPRFGSIVSNAEMIGHIEYTVAGRYEMIPVSSLFFECIRPFLQDLPVGLQSISAASAGVSIFIILIISGWNGQRIISQIRKLKIYFYLLIASVVLYVLARIFLLKLFIPSRYLEFSLTVFYCLLAGILVRSAVDSIRSDRYRTVLIVLLICLGAFRLKGVALYDYGGQATLYKFFQSTSRESNIAGHPYLMDNIMTFSQRKVFVSYELSHPWYGKYWSIIKPMTYDFFNAYYSESPNEIREFCRKYAINYFVVRESDFTNKMPESTAYFQPFGSHIRKLLEKNTSFAVLDGKEFMPVFHDKNIRVLTPLD